MLIYCLWCPFKTPQTLVPSKQGRPILSFAVLAHFHRPPPSVLPFFGHLSPPLDPHVQLPKPPQDPFPRLHPKPAELVPRILRNWAFQVRKMAAPASKSELDYHQLWSLPVEVAPAHINMAQCLFQNNVDDLPQNPNEKQLSHLPLGVWSQTKTFCEARICPK